MSISIKLEDIDVVLLCGGLGRRLRPLVKDRPKPMAEINDKPFLDILINYIVNFGLRRFILCIGYLGEVIKRYYQGKKFPFEIIFSEEAELLGTAGAIKHAEPFIRSSPFLVMNGDSFCRVDLRKFFSFHLDNSALISMVLASMKDTEDFGTVTLGDSQRIAGFNEKSKTHKSNFVNAGVYLFQCEALSLIPPNKKFTLERDFLPKIVDKQFYGYAEQETFIDIGTPKRYKEAKRALGI